MFNNLYAHARTRFFTIFVVFALVIPFSANVAARDLSSPVNSILAANSLSSSYSQNFDTLAASGTGITWTDDATIPGWYSNRTTYIASAGTSTSGALYSFGTGTNTERALGSIASSSTNTIRYGVRFINDTGNTVTLITVSYTGEQWRNGGNTTQHTLSFAYQIGAAVTDLNSGTWTSVTALNFTGPIATSTAAALDGNASANRVAISASFAVSIAPNQEIMLRWSDPDDSGNDHGLAIDDLTVTATVSDAAPAVSSVTPANGATGVAVDADISVTFSEAVAADGSWYLISCASSGTHTAAVTSGSTIFTLNPNSNFANGESCTVTLYAAQITDQDANDPPNNMAVDYSWSFTTVAPVATNVIINEVDADTPSTDVAEFIELYDGGVGNTSLTGLAVVLFNGNGDISYAVFDLDGRSTDSNGYFVICGNSANVVNCDWDVTPDSDLVQNGADAVALYQANGADFPNGTAVTTANLVDALVYDTNDADDPGLLVLLNIDEPQVNEGGQGDSANHSNQRCPNGSGGARNTSNYNQASPTPGVANVCSAGGSCATIPEIQGTGNASPCLGHRSNIQGCITGVAATGFYFQDVAGDGNIATSDGIYAYYFSTWTNPYNFQPGDLVQVSGTVVEYYDTTEFAHKSADELEVTRLGSCTVPAPATITPITDPTADLMTLYERYEGMRVQMTFDGWVVGATKRFDSRYTVDDPEIAFVDFSSSVPDYSRVFERDYAGYQGIQYLGGGLNFDLPDLDFGDRIAGTNVTGVLGYQFSKYTLLVDAAPTLSTVDNTDVVAINPAHDPTKAEVDVCFFNVENLFDNVDDGDGDWGDWAPGYPTPGTQAGLDAYNAKLATVAAVIVNRLRSCMVVGVEEMEGKQAVYDALASALHAADASHSWTGIYVESGDSRDISQGFFYRNDVTLLSGPTPVSGSPYTTWLSDGTLDFVRVPATAFFRFHAGTPYYLDVHLYAVHFKSKASSTSCSTPDCTDRRELEAADMRDILAHHQTAGEYAIAGGDYNDTFGSSPINILDAASANIYSPFYDLPPTERWSYVFNGESEVLDHLYMTNNLLYATSGWNHAFNPVHVNADFPSREHASDHDPLRLRLRLPSDYGSLSGYGQVWHLRIPGYTLRLGSAWTDDTVFDPAADDTGDGGVLFGTFRAGEQASLTINVQGTPRIGRYLHAWFDWDANGVFDTAERVFSGSLNDGNNTINFLVPAGFTQAVNYRIRLYDGNGIMPMGADPDAGSGANGGEVDDGTSPSPTAVTLAAFTATPQDAAILVAWETASELDNVGFNLYRSATPDGPYTRLNATLIPPQNPGSVLGAVYEWPDTDVQPGAIYFYKLEDLDVKGVSTFHGPVSSASVSAPNALAVDGLRARGAWGWSGLGVAALAWWTIRCACPSKRRSRVEIGSA